MFNRFGDRFDVGGRRPGQRLDLRRTGSYADGRGADAGLFGQGEGAGGNGHRYLERNSTYLGGGDLVIYDVVARKESKRVAIGHGAAGILMQPDGARAFISCGPDNYVAVLDLKTLEVVGHIDAGGEPDGLAWASQR